MIFVYLIGNLMHFLFNIVEVERIFDVLLRSSRTGDGMIPGVYIKILPNNYSEGA